MAEVCESVIPTLHIAVLGPPGSGKTCLINSWVNNYVPSVTPPTKKTTTYYRSVLLPNPLHEGDHFTTLVEVTDCVLQDDAGQFSAQEYKKFCKATGRGEGMMSSYKHPMHDFEADAKEPSMLAKSRMGFIVLFDATSSSSLEAAKEYIAAHPLLESNPGQGFPLRLVANKMDSHQHADEIKANIANALDFCFDQKIESEKVFRQISVTDYAGVRELFDKLLEECIDETSYWATSTLKSQIEARKKKLERGDNCAMM